MGKLEQSGTEEEENPDGGGVSSDRCSFLLFCGKSTSWWIFPVALGLHLLVFLILSLSYYYGRSAKHNRSSPTIAPEAQIQASFFLRKPVSKVNVSLLQLVSELHDEFTIPNTQVVVLSLVSLPMLNWTWVVFGILPKPWNSTILPADLSLLRGAFVELFLNESANLTLSDEMFGKAYDFQTQAFPGGITVALKHSSDFSLLVLFNFTLHRTLSHVDSKIMELKQQLTNGIHLNANESLFVQLTNSHGSTMDPLIIVQTSVMPRMGLLSTSRLKKLAHDVISSPRRNLGLNHALFGRVKQIKLSTYLSSTLEPSPSLDISRTLPSEKRKHHKQRDP